MIYIEKKIVNYPNQDKKSLMDHVALQNPKTLKFLQTIPVIV